MTKSRIYFFSITVFIVLFLILGSNSVFAQGLVPCGTRTNPTACTVCDLFVLLQKILNFLTKTAASLATLAIVYIGLLFLLSGGSSKKTTEAKEKLWLVLWGIFWIFGSWLVLNTIINFVADPDVFPWRVWNQVDCRVSQQPFVADQEIPVPEPILPESAMSETEARNRFQQAGIAVNKSACPAGVAWYNVPGGCTSLNGVTATTLIGAAQLKNDCQCSLTITGGTEQGHAQGTLSHANGDKLDFRPNAALDGYIEKNFISLKSRSDGAKQYQAPSGSVYAREGDHWDVTFRQ